MSGRYPQARRMIRTARSPPHERYVATPRRVEQGENPMPRDLGPCRPAASSLLHERQGGVRRVMRGGPMERLNTTDAGFYFAEHERTPLHIASVAIFEGPVPAQPEVERMLLARLELIPRYRQRVQTVPFGLGRPVWTDDPRFQLEYHLRRTAVPHPGGAAEFGELAGRVLGHRLDLSRSPWEIWLVEGLEEGRWALISKVHHCVVDGVAGSDLI